MPPFVSNDCSDLLKQMIHVDPETRITAVQALNHQWFKSNTSSPVKMSQEDQDLLNKQVVEKLKKYRGQSQLKKAAFNVLVKTLET